MTEPTALFLTGEYYEETDHPNSARVPRGWGIQGSLFSLAPYAKIGWYGERETPGLYRSVAPAGSFSNGATTLNRARRRGWSASRTSTP